MSKNISRIVLTGGPAAGKTTLISRILKEFKQEDGWRVITIPETATDLISGFGIKPFGNCVSMLEFQYFVVADQLHKEKLALKAAETVPEDNILIIYDRAVFDDKAYISSEEFTKVLAYFGKTEEQMMAGYDAVLHLVSCAKGAEFAYNYGNAARYEDIEGARRMDDLTLEAWKSHPKRIIIDNSVNFDEKIGRAIKEIYKLVGQTAPETGKAKYLISMPGFTELEKYNPARMDMMQTYLTQTNPSVIRRVRQQKNGSEYLYFYTERRTGQDGVKWVTERPISEKEYVAFLMEADLSLHAVRKTKLRFGYLGQRIDIDIYPFSEERAIAFVFGGGDAPKLPPELEALREVTDDPEFKNINLAKTQKI